MYNKKNVMVLGELHRTIVFSNWTEFHSYFFNLKNIYRKKCSNIYIYEILISAVQYWLRI